MTAAKLIGSGQQGIVLPPSFTSKRSSAGVEVVVEVPLLDKVGGKPSGLVSVTLMVTALPSSSSPPLAASAATGGAVTSISTTVVEGSHISTSPPYALSETALSPSLRAAATPSKETYAQEANSLPKTAGERVVSGEKGSKPITNGTEASTSSSIQSNMFESDEKHTNAAHSDWDVTCFVSKITTAKLKNVEMMYGDKNDVFVLLKFGDKWSARTTTIWEGGSDVSWSYNESVDSSMKWTTSVSSLTSVMLDVSAMDDNKMTAAKLIGSGQQGIVLPASFRTSGVGAGAGAGVEVVVEVPLLDKVGGKPSGSVSVTLMVTAVPSSSSSPPLASGTASAAGAPSIHPSTISAPSSSSSAPPVALKRAESPTGAADSNPAVQAFSSGVLLIKRIKCSELKNVEMLGKNDPYVTLDFGTQNFKTEPLENVGSEALFDYLDIKFDVDEGVLKYENMTVKVFDKNSARNDVIIGSSSFSLKNFLTKLDKEIDIPVYIEDEKGKRTGHITLYGQLIPQRNTGISSESKFEEVQVPNNFEPILLRVVRIKLFELKYVGAILSNKVSKPYAKLSLGTKQQETKPIDALGNISPVLDHLDMSFEVDSMMLTETVSDKGSKDMKTIVDLSILIVDIFDSVVGFDPLICTGSVSIKNATLKDFGSIITNKIPSEIELTVNLTTKKGETAGRAVLYVTRQILSQVISVEKMSADPVSNSADDDKLREEFKGGVFRVESITAHDLKNTEMIGKQVRQLYLYYQASFC
jgi:C2 domain